MGIDSVKALTQSWMAHHGPDAVAAVGRGASGVMSTGATPARAAASGAFFAKNAGYPRDYFSTREAVLEKLGGWESKVPYAAHELVRSVVDANRPEPTPAAGPSFVSRHKGKLLGAAGLAGAAALGYGIYRLQKGKKEKEKLAWSWDGFKEGLRDEGIPLAGATLGAGVGSIYNKGLTGAALGYALGGGASILRSKLQGKEVSPEQKMLALGALGYGAGGLAHAGLGRLRPHGIFGEASEVVKTVPGAWRQKLVRGLTEEGLPALGATLGTAYAVGSSKQHPNAPQVTAP